MFASSPLWAQTPAAPAGSTNRTEDPAYSVFRWIKIQGDAQRKPAADAPKPKPKSEPAAAPVRKPDTQATAPSTITERPQPGTPAQGPTATAPAESAPQAASNVVPVTSSPVAAVTAAAAAAPVAPAAEASDELDADLKILSQAQPEFPRELRTAISHGKVVVSFTVQPDGTVAEPTVVSYTNRKLGKPATDAVAKWVFEPVRIARTVQVEIAFSAQ
jgi:protein TonB